LPSIYIVGGEVSAPKLVSVDAKVVAPDTCKDKVEGHVSYQFVLDKAGIPRDLGFVQSDEFKLNDLARGILLSERFQPALKAGEPVAVSFVAILTLNGCQVETQDDRGNKVKAFRAIEKPGQKIVPFTLNPEDARWALGYSDPDKPIDGGVLIPRSSKGHGVSPPIPLNNVEAEFSDEAKKQHINGIVIVTTVVDTTEMPRDIRVIRPCGYGLDEEAIKAVHKYRFKPAMEGGHPVAMPISVEINFQNN
jgi:TonB family protein